jgi:hypothetical protein
MLRGIKMLFATLVVAGVAAGVATAGVTQNDVNQTIPFSVFVPCANGGAGENVSGTINLHILTTSTVNGNNVSGKFHYQPQSSSLVGDVTGDAYQATGVTQENFKSSLTNGQANFTFVNNFRIIGQGPGNNFLVHEVTHLTVNANGDTTVTFDNFSVDCK